jgi:uncharacterized protein (TIGR03435 family)
MKSKIGRSVCAVALTVIATPRADAQQVERVQQVEPASLPRFEVASVKPSPADWKVARNENPPGSLVQQNQTLGDILTVAFDLRRDRIAGAPDWVWQERFSIDARMPATRRSMQDRWLMLRALLVDRFKLQYHIERGEVEGYVLTAARADGRLGPDLRHSTANCSNRRIEQDNVEVGDDCKVLFSYGLIDAHGIPLTILRNMILGSVDRYVVVSPDLAGDFDIKFQFGPARTVARVDDQPAAATGTSIYTNLREQLGLKLEPSRIAVERLVIDHIERPSEN